MKILQKKYTKEDDWKIIRGDKLDPEVYNFVLAFGSTELLNESSIYKSIQNSYPKATILINSTAGEIIDTQISDNSMSLTERVQIFLIAFCIMLNRYFVY
ncbi:MAG TPA: hypothetical protein VNZ49_13485 [Bacteroidia bacterium]|jgi:hypothetical protein|nr:hypothetical protein [Bacteroidia bacterium]